MLNIELHRPGLKAIYGTYEVRNGLVLVQYDGQKKAREFGSTPPISMARILLQDLAATS